MVGNQGYEDRAGRNDRRQNLGDVAQSSLIACVKWHCTDRNIRTDAESTVAATRFAGVVGLAPPSGSSQDRQSGQSAPESLASILRNRALSGDASRIGT